MLVRFELLSSAMLVKFIKYFFQNLCGCDIFGPFALCLAWLFRCGRAPRRRRRPNDDGNRHPNDDENRNGPDDDEDHQQPPRNIFRRQNRRLNEEGFNKFHSKFFNFKRSHSASNDNNVEVELGLKNLGAHNLNYKDPSIEIEKSKAKDIETGETVET